MPHAIGDLALLADRRTAALVGPDGNVVWLPWPRIDSEPLLLSMLDQDRGGAFSLRPARGDARVVSRRYHAGTLVLETLWEVGRSRLVVDDALLLGGSPTFARRIRAEGDPVDVVVRFQPGPYRADATVSCPAVSRRDGGSRVSRFTAAASTSYVLLGGGERTRNSLDHDFDGTLAAWRRMSPDPLVLRPSETASRALSESVVRELIVTSACVLLGLHSQEGGIVAAPTTSLPQWPGTQRTWDYRYCWMRDGALAASALLRLRLTDDAHSLASFLGHVAQRDEPPAVVRVDGGPPPDERMHVDLAGWAGSRPVRTGNAAARQLQIDITGELTQLASLLSEAGAMPESLVTACTRLADWAADRWSKPDHGIWEIRGEPRHYTHSRVMAWTALRDATALAQQGAIDGDTSRWSRVADAIRARVLGTAADSLQLTESGGGPDAALASVPSTGFLPAEHPMLRTTLDLIAGRLDRNGLLDRCLPEQEALPDPCGPFLFPTFWMAGALECTGRSGTRHFAAAAAARGRLGLFGEVADPETHTPLGNYPQVQSHASFVLAATEP